MENVSKKLLGCLILFSFCLVELALAVDNTEMEPPGIHQIEWLARQQDLHTSGLLESYENNGDTNAWIFDQALAIIAFTNAGELGRARRILDSMKSLQHEEPEKGAWYQCYDAIHPNRICNNEFVTGPISWMVIAINFYEDMQKDPNYAPMARNALCWLDTMMNTNDPNDEKYGSMKFSVAFPYIISTEHNQDAYSAYYWRGILDSNDLYLEKADLIMDFLRKEMWAPSPNSNHYHDVNVFWRGWESTRNLKWCTDVQAWGILSLGPVGPDGEQFNKSLCWLADPQERVTFVIQDYNDYITKVFGYKGLREDGPYIEVDFTEHVAAAFFAVGDDWIGSRLHEQMRRIVSANGGLVHSFCDHDPNIVFMDKAHGINYHNYRYNYVASVAWFYLNEVKINPFRLSSAPDMCRTANVNKTSAIDIIDLSLLSLNWLNGGKDLTGDINGDEIVDFLDISIFAKYWLCGYSYSLN